MLIFLHSHNFVTRLQQTAALASEGTAELQGVTADGKRIYKVKKIKEQGKAGYKRATKHAV